MDSSRISITNCVFPTLKTLLILLIIFRITSQPPELTFIYTLVLITPATIIYILVGKFFSHKDSSNIRHNEKK